MADLLELTADIVGAYLSKNKVPVGELPNMIDDVSQAIAGLTSPAAFIAKKQEPAVNPKRSVFPDYIISLEDGQKFQALKRPLMVRHGLTPEQYRLKWGLPADYPMVAPNYAATRSALAKKMGLGRKPEVKAPAKRGRAKSR